MIKNCSYTAKMSDRNQGYEYPRVIRNEDGRCRYSTAQGFDDITFEAAIVDSRHPSPRHRVQKDI